MAPYCGPNLAALVTLLRDGARQEITLGNGLPRATLYFRDEAFELHGMSGGEGFGVQADLVNPFVDEGVLVRAATWQELVTWLCEHWDRGSYGDPLGRGEQLRVSFSGDLRALGLALHRELGSGISDAMNHARDGIVAATLDVAAGACRAARAANATIDFAVLGAGKRKQY